MGFRLLGRFEVVAEESGLEIGGPKQRAVLALLALEPNVVVPMDRLVTAVWGDDAPPSTKGLVRTYVSRLRGVLGGAGWELQGRPPGYVLYIDRDDVDVHRFEAGLHQARACITAGRLQEALELVDRALGLWRGEALADLHGFDFARAAGSRLEEERLRAREERFDVKLALGHHAEVIGDLEALVAEHPLREVPWGQLMVALYRSGRQAEALAGYQRLRSTLADRLGIDPNHELQALEHDILTHAESLRWQPPADGHGPAKGPEIDPGMAADTPVQVGRPPIPAMAYEERATLAARLGYDDRNDGGASDDLGDVILTGGGGVGKTQLAAATFRRARRCEVELLVWVDASSRGSILEAYAHAYRATRPAAAPAQPTDEAAEAFLALLATTSLRWLVVLDDVSSPAHVRGLWPEGPAGRVVATTRRRDLAVPGALALVVDVFSPAEACNYLAARLSGSAALAAHPQALNQASELGDDLGRLPVALAQAAAVILNEGITCAGYRERFADRSRRLSQLLPPDTPADDYPGSLVTTWKLAAEEADRLPPPGVALRALHLAAAADPNGAPASLWSTLPAERYLAGDAAEADRPAGTGTAALRNLHRFNLVDHDPGTGLVRMHALVQRAVLDALPVDHRADLVRVVADALVELWDAHTGATDDTLVVRQNLTTLAHRGGEALYSPRAHDVLFCAGRGLETSRLMDEAVGHWKDVATTGARLLGPTHVDVLTARMHLADCHGEAGDARQAADVIEGVLEDRRRILGDDHPDTLATRHGLIWWVGTAGDPAEAVRQLEDLLRHTVAVLGDDHRHTLATRNHLAYWQGEAGDPSAAADTTHQLLRDRRHILGDDHPDTLATRHHLASWQGEANGPEDAIAILKDLLDDRERTLGPDHPDTRTTRHHLELWQRVAGDGAEATSAVTALRKERHRGLAADTNAQAARLGQAGHGPGRRWSGRRHQS